MLEIERAVNTQEFGGEMSEEKKMAAAAVREIEKMN